MWYDVNGHGDFTGTEHIFQTRRSTLNSATLTTFPVTTPRPL